MSPWLLAARSMVEGGPVMADQLDLPVHLAQHPACAVAGKTDRVFTRCCGKPVPLGRPMWSCEIPLDAGLSLDCCERPYLVYGD